MFPHMQTHTAFVLLFVCVRLFLLLRADTLRGSAAMAAMTARHSTAQLLFIIIISSIVRPSLSNSGKQARVVNVRAFLFSLSLLLAYRAFPFCKYEKQQYYQSIIFIALQFATGSLTVAPLCKKGKSKTKPPKTQKKRNNNHTHSHITPLLSGLLLLRPINGGKVHGRCCAQSSHQLHSSSLTRGQLHTHRLVSAPSLLLSPLIASFLSFSFFFLVFFARHVCCHKSHVPLVLYAVLAEEPLAMTDNELTRLVAHKSLHQVRCP